VKSESRHCAEPKSSLRRAEEPSLRGVPAKPEASGSRHCAERESSLRRAEESSLRGRRSRPKQSLINLTMTLNKDN